MKINRNTQRYSLCILLCAVLFSSPYLVISFIENDLTWITKRDWSDCSFRAMILIEGLGSLLLAIFGIQLTELILD